MPRPRRRSTTGLRVADDTGHRRRTELLHSSRCFPHRCGSSSSSTSKPRAGSIDIQIHHARSSLSCHRVPAVQACVSVMSGFASTSTPRTGVMAARLGARLVRSTAAKCSLTRVSSRACRGSSHSRLAALAHSGTSISTSLVSSGLSSSTLSEPASRSGRSILAVSGAALQFQGATKCEPGSPGWFRDDMSLAAAKKAVAVVGIEDQDKSDNRDRRANYSASDAGDRQTQAKPHGVCARDRCRRFR